MGDDRKIVELHRLRELRDCRGKAIDITPMSDAEFRRICNMAIDLAAARAEVERVRGGSATLDLLAENVSRSGLTLTCIERCGDDVFVVYVESLDERKRLATSGLCESLPAAIQRCAEVMDEKRRAIARHATGDTT